ncbi:hypothetical protein [Moorena sp. SIO4G3]|uniref:hypothetical protein n=1 Tax=Moorena sp. SIO4G3 TaxID=2607821 RepID=UPI0025EE539D|nr:hypothetical protein [Moorena sp. SIO4G3]
MVPPMSDCIKKGILSHPKTELIESSGKHWVSEIECSRHILGNNQWQRVDSVASGLKTNYPEIFRHKFFRCRYG